MGLVITEDIYSS